MNSQVKVLHLEQPKLMIRRAEDSQERTWYCFLLESLKPEPVMIRKIDLRTTECSALLIA